MTGGGSYLLAAYAVVLATLALYALRLRLRIAALLDETRQRGGRGG
jgi:hypothetical protein